MKGYFFSVRHMVKYRKTERRDSNALNSSDRFIHIFTQEVTMRLNKENIYTGTSPEIFNRIRSALEVKKIKYEYDIISQRNLTVSTCGLVPEMLRLAEEKLQITLALSLHAPNDEKRQELMPIARKYTMEEVLNACRIYFEKTGRRITFEYSLVAGMNDSEENARELSGRIRDINCHVNLIPVNPVKERSFQRPTREAAENFKIKLEKCGINVTIRREMGSDIDGACGQLRKSYMEKTESEK